MEVDMVNRFSVPTKDNTTKLQITFPPTVKYYKELYLYETLSLLAGTQSAILVSQIKTQI